MDTCIGWLNSAGEVLIPAAIRMLIQSSVLILILLLLDLALRGRVRAVVRYWIWLLVLAKLLLPPSLSLPTGLFSWVGHRLPQANQVLLPSPPVVERGIPAPLAVEITTGAPQTPGAEASGTIPWPAATIPDTALWTWQGLATVAWAAAVAVMLLILIQRAFLVSGLTAMAQDAPADLADLVEQCRRQMGVRSVRVRIASLSPSPSVCGLLRPVIFLPEHVGRQLDKQQLRCVLLHELAHIKRGDLWISLLQTLLQIVYLYNPLLWLANARIRRVREQAVDETVLASMGEDAEQYPRTLLSMSRLAFGRGIVGLRLLGVVESKKALSSRIRLIVSRPFPRSARLGLAGLALVLAVGAVFLPMAKAEDQGVGAGEPASSIASTAPTDGTTAKDGATPLIPQKASAPVGIVVTAEGTPVRGARVMLYYRKTAWGLGNAVVQETRTDRQGRFKLTKPLVYANSNGTTYTDHYILFAAHPDHAIAWQVIVGGAARSNYRLTLTKPVTQAFLVTDQEGRPLRKARIWIRVIGLDDDPNPVLRPNTVIPQDIGLLSAVTDRQGRATVGNLPCTHCAFAVSLKGCSDAYKMVGIPPKGEAIVKMTRAGTVIGRVLTQDGKPVAGAEIWFRADWGLVQSDYAITDRSGRFTHDRLTGRGASWVPNRGTGQYKVSLRHPRYTAPEQTVQLEPGQVVKDFNFKVTQGTLLRVRVRDPGTERPIAGGRVQGSSTSGTIDGYTDANGIWEGRVENGNTRIAFMYPPNGTCMVVGDEDIRSEQITTDGGVQEVNLYAPSRLYPLVSIRGRLTLPDGSPAASVKISTANHIGRYYTAKFVGTGNAYTRTNSDGTFELVDVPQGAELFLYAETSNYRYVLAEVLNPMQASPEIGRPLVMQEGRSASVVLADASGNPRANMALLIRPRKWDQMLFHADDRRAKTDAEGKLPLDGIVPGLEYLIRDAKANLSQPGWPDLYNENRILLELPTSGSR